MVSKGVKAMLTLHASRKYRGYMSKAQKKRWRRAPCGPNGRRNVSVRGTGVKAYRRRIRVRIA